MKKSATSFGDALNEGGAIFKALTLKSQKSLKSIEASNISRQPT
jgi:hypothetical protein